MASASKEYDTTKWNGKDNFVCKTKGCSFATLNKHLIEAHVEVCGEVRGVAATSSQGGDS